MDYFQYKNNQLFAENVDINLLTQKVDTPFYLYSKATIERHWHAFNDSFPQHPHLICYAVKANSTLAILSLLAKLGSGFDIVSVGELERVLKAGGKASKIVFSGVGKKSHELKRALEVGIKCFNIESEEELIRLNQVAINLNVIAPVSIRVNPDVDAKTHPYIATGLKDNKFGIDIKKAFDQYIIADQLSHIKVVGIDCHIGSQLTQITPFLDALDRVLELNQKLSDVGIKIQHLDLGGGLGICYQDEQPPLPAEYGNAIMQKMTNIPMEIIIEPGRAIVGNAGILVTEVEYIKN
ncbi:MAG: diaminopimelate decarboxylase, partial [Methylococcales bacterium]|nr:diaminopimelate decarboxylase [Methylococcales bacterium]